MSDSFRGVHLNLCDPLKIFTRSPRAIIAQNTACFVDVFLKATFIFGHISCIIL